MSTVLIKPQPDEVYIAQLRADFPDLQVRSLQHIGSGWHTAAMLVNDTFVFRFPRELFEDPDKLRPDKTRKELAILKALRGKLQVAIPGPVYIADGERYFGYRLVPGTLWQRFPGLEGHESDVFLENWLEVRRAISGALPADEARRLGVPLYHFDSNEETIAKIRVADEESRALRRLGERALHIVRTELGSPDDWQFTHGDLQAQNCTVNEGGTALKGVFDFGDAQIGPPESDYYFWCGRHNDTLERLKRIEAARGRYLNVPLIEAIAVVYDVADYQLCTEKGYTDDVARLQREIDWWQCHLPTWAR